jgi:purF: amidophosphoribosyltransferase
MKLHMR